MAKTMKDYRTKKRLRNNRIELTDREIQRLSDDVSLSSIPELAKQTGLPYLLIYNVAHRRVKSISEQDYRILFGEAPPAQQTKKVYGSEFIAMVELWLFLNEGVTKSDLYKEFYAGKPPKRVDYRIFTGQTNTVEPELERMMRKKFSDAGIEEQTLERWMDELVGIGHDDRISYERIRPILVFLENELGVHPTRILNRSLVRYESGMLKSVSRTIYDNAVKLKKKTEKALEKRSSLEIDKIKDSIYGEKPDYTFYAEVEEELNFLRKYANKSAKRYLGRGTWTYEQKRAKRIASWRAAKILDDCDRFIQKTPELSFSALPRSRQKMAIQRLLGPLVTRTARMLSEQEGIIFEKQILRPSHSREAYKQQDYGFTQFDRAFSTLGMRKKAFDLMVAKNCEMFRTVGRYDKRWYLSDLYLKELSEKAYFDLVSAKYEIMAKELNRTSSVNECMY